MTLYGEVTIEVTILESLISPQKKSSRKENGCWDIFGANWTGNPPVKLWLNLPDFIVTDRYYLPLILR